MGEICRSSRRQTKTGRPLFILVPRNIWRIYNRFYSRFDVCVHFRDRFKILKFVFRNPSRKTKNVASSTNLGRKAWPSRIWWRTHTVWLRPSKMPVSMIVVDLDQHVWRRFLCAFQEHRFPCTSCATRLTTTWLYLCMTMQCIRS